MSTEKARQTVEDPVRPHVFDGIQEYDKRMPNWWLFTLYGAIAYSAIYWGYFHAWQMGEDPGRSLERQMERNTMAAARDAGVMSDEVLWSLSRDPKFVEAGKATYASTCASCHQPDLSGGIGPNLKDNVWLHGGAPVKVAETISNGVLAKGMPAWAPVLGKSKITEVTAYILSFHKPGETTASPAAPAAK